MKLYNLIRIHMNKKQDAYTDLTYFYENNIIAFNAKRMYF